jgi:hypothetical protein
MEQNQTLMTSPPDVKSNFNPLKERIQKLIHLSEELNKANKKLLAEKRQLTLQIEDEKEKIKRMEEGYRNLKEIEKSSSRQSISNMKRKISDIILEIDRNMSMIEDSHK